MNKLALIGRDISHSRSPEMYRKLISPSINYDLLDYKEPSQIPSAVELLKKYDGINITSPYKKHFLNQIELTKNAKEIGAINCLKKEGTRIIGENTDYLAIVDILQDLYKTYGSLNVVILGDGVMSNVTQIALKHLKKEYLVLSRKITKNFDHLNLPEYLGSEVNKLLLINTCAREYVFQGKLPSQAVFWDYNYNFEAHKIAISPLVERYMDGLEMLERQAFYAVSFWSHNTPF